MVATTVHLHECRRGGPPRSNTPPGGAGTPLGIGCLNSRTSTVQGEKHVRIDAATSGHSVATAASHCIETALQLSQQCGLPAKFESSVSCCWVWWEMEKISAPSPLTQRWWHGTVQRVYPPCTAALESRHPSWARQYFVFRHCFSFCEHK